MASLVNETARLFVIGGVKYIPLKPVEVANVEKLQKQFPEVGELIKTGAFKLVDKKEAAKIEADFEKMEVEELKAYAKANNIEIGKTVKKENLLKIIRDAENKRLAEKV